MADYPALLSWRTDEDDGGLLGMATGSYGDSGDEFHERHFTRKECSELLLDAGAVVAPSVCDGLIRSRAQALIDLFHRRGLLPRTLKFFAAIGDVDPFMYACHLRHKTAAALLLDRAITFDAELGRRIDSGPGRSAFIEYFIANKPDVHNPDPFEAWKDLVKQQVDHAMRDGNMTTFVDGLRREPWMLSEASVKFQARLIEVAVLNDRAVLLDTFFDLNPAVLHTRVPPPSQAIESAFTYVKTHLLPMLLRIWPMPDDLPHAAGNGDLTSEALVWRRGRCAREGMSGYGLLHTVSDGLCIGYNSTELVWSQVCPGSSQRVQPFQVPGLLPCIVRAEVYAQHQKLACRCRHSAFVRNHIPVQNVASLP